MRYYLFGVSSHIPADRKGLTFFTFTGEISKPDEQAILVASGQDWSQATTKPGVLEALETAAAYVVRYVSAYGPQALADPRIGV